MNQRFNRWAQVASDATGRAPAFFVAFALVVAWAVAGPFMGFSEVWMLLINTLTTIVTFLMVFIIQSTTNRLDAALHRKVDEIVVDLPDVDSSVAGIEQET